MRIDESKEREREKKKYLPFFPGVEKIPAERKWVNKNHPQGGKDKRGKKGKRG